MIPEPWEFALLGLAAFRTFWLVAEDTIFDAPRDWLTRRGEREYVLLFLTCPWCAGFWIAFGWWAAWWWLGEWAVAAAAPFALSALVGLVTLVAHLLVDA